MAYCKGDGKVPGVTLSSWADPCPWGSPADACNHFTQIINGRRSAIYKVEITSKPIFKQVNLDGAPYVIKRYTMIAKTASSPVESFNITKNPPVDPSWATRTVERITTTATYLPASHWAPDQEEGTDTEPVDENEDNLSEEEALNKVNPIVARYELIVP